MKAMRNDGQSGEGTDPLWQSYFAAPEVELRAELVARYVPLVRTIAASAYARRVNDALEFLDLYQWGIIGLLEAMERYIPGQGTDFRTFATPRIRGEILDGITRATEVASQVSSRNRLLKERANAVSSASASPLEALMSMSVGLAIGFMLEDTGMFQPEAGPQEFNDSAYQACEVKQLSEAFRKKVALLPAKQQKVIRLHYFHGLAFSEIAKMLALTKGRVSQLHKEGLDGLRSLLRADEVNWSG